MPKRNNSDIEQYEGSNGEKLFRFRIYLGTNPVNGKKVTKRRSKFTSYSAADEAYKQLAAQGIQPDYDEKSTFADVWALWYNEHRHAVRPSTELGIDVFWRLHIEPYLGDTYISQITPAMLQKYSNVMADKIVNYTTPIAYVKRVLQYAVILGMIPSNPMDRVMVSKKKPHHTPRKADNFFTRTQTTTFLNAAKKSSKRNYAYFSILAMTGARRSEALVLTWNDIDLDNGLLKITKTAAHDKQGRMMIGPPKTQRGYRTIPMPDELVDILWDYKSTTKGDILFPGRNTPYADLSRPSLWFDQVYKQLPKDFKRITIHGLRHTYATMMYQANPNISPKDMQALLGHESIRMSLDLYTHVTDEAEQRTRKAANRLNLLTPPQNENGESDD